MNPLRQLSHRLRLEEAGISLVEVMVAITVLAITMAAVASTTISSLQVARDSRESVLAANIAQFELERLRSIPFVDWVVTAREDGGNSTTLRQQVDATDNHPAYEIFREVIWVSSGSDTDGCTAAVEGQGEGADYVRVNQTISFPGRDDIDPVTNQTIITPRLDFYDPETGNLAVVVRDRDGAGAPGHVVSIQGLAGTEVATTDSNGCAFFPFLDVDPDNPANNAYDLTIDASECHIDRATLVTTINDVAYIQAQQTAVLEYQYPECAELEVRPIVPETPLYTAAGDRRPTSDCTIVETAGALQCLDNTTNNPVPTLYDGTTWAAQIPQDVGYSLENGNLGRVVKPSRTPDDDPDVDVRPDVITPLYPFAAGYNAYAGRCLESSPLETGASDKHLFASEPGEVTVGEVEMATVTVFSGFLGPDTADRDGDGDVTEEVLYEQPQQDVWAEMLHTDDCADGDRLYLGRTDDNGRLTVVMPFGTWYLYHQAPGAGGVIDPPRSGGPYSCDPSSTPAAPTGSCFEVRADYEVTQEPDGTACGGPGSDLFGIIDPLLPGSLLDLTTDCATTASAELGYVYIVPEAP